MSMRRAEDSALQCAAAACIIPRQRGSKGEKEKGREEREGEWDRS